MSSLVLPFSGSLPCGQSYASGKRQGERCVEVARYFEEGKFFCGMHSSSSDSIRQALPKRNKEEQVRHQRLQDEKYEALVQDAAQQNRKAGRIGEVVLFKKQMLHNVTRQAGYRDYYPNFKDHHPPGGVGMPLLSPKQPFQVIHGQPHVPIATSIENFHQQSKCYFWETMDQFRIHRNAGFQCMEPHRHKTPQSVLHCMKNAGLSVEEQKEEDDSSRQWRCFVWMDENEQEHELEMSASRQFYCKFYEQYVRNRLEFKQMQDALNRGENIRICGYDARPLRKDNYEDEYLDSSRSFGHERVLWTMLKISKESDWPWRKYRTFRFPGCLEDPPSVLRKNKRSGLEEVDVDVGGKRRRMILSP